MNGSKNSNAAPNPHRKKRSNAARLDLADQQKLEERARAAGMLHTPYVAFVLAQHVRDPESRVLTVGEAVELLAELGTIMAADRNDDLDEAATRSYLARVLRERLKAGGGS